MRLNMTPNSPRTIQAENDALRQRIAYLEAQLAVLRQTEANDDSAPQVTPTPPYSWELG